MFRKLLFILILGLVSVCRAQKSDFGKVTIKELEEKVYPLDTTAPAAIVFNNAKTIFRYETEKGFMAVHEYEIRIKIYKKDGLKWANFEVPYYVGYETLRDDRVKFTAGTTYNLENGQIIKTKLSGEGKFKKELNEYWGEASIAMPNVKVGSIIEFKYTLKSNDLGEFPVFNFQYDIPVKHAEYITEIPEFYIYKPVIIGFGNVKSDAKIGKGHQTFDNKHNQTTMLDYQQINSSYVADDIPALKDEPFVDNLANYRSSVQHELDRIRFPEQPVKNISTTWEGVANTIYKDKKFGDELNARQYFEQDLPAVIRGKETEMDKAEAILAFVKRTIAWNNKYGYYVRNGVKQAYQNRSGNVAEVNFILISMLNHAGINANPVLVSTVSNGIPVFPNLRVFNYVIAAAQIDGQQVLLDATDKYSAPNVLPDRALNWNGRLVRRDGTSLEVNLVPVAASRTTANLMAKIGADGKISGKTRIHKTAYSAHSARSKYAGINQQQYVEKLEDDWGKIQLSEYVAENWTESGKPLTETFTFVSDNHAEKIEDRLYIDPMLFFATEKNPFVLENRKLPIYYGYPVQSKYSINLEIPEGYAVESLPQPINVSTGENIGLFTFSLVQNGNKIQLLVSEEINSALLSASFYETLKEFYRKMVEKQTEKIVLKKT